MYVMPKTPTSNTRERLISVLLELLFIVESKTEVDTLIVDTAINDARSILITLGAKGLSVDNKDI